MTLARRLPVVRPDHAPAAPFLRLSTLWVQVTGTWCNLACPHCVNASGPTAPWLAPLDAGVARQAIRDAEDVGVRDIYFTGGEPFLHPSSTCSRSRWRSPPPRC
jgi:AdoMet-dependent heme synthase